MPQLALETFVTQYFWLIVVLSAFFVTSTFYVIPRISQMMKVREKVGQEETNGEAEGSTVKDNIILNTVSPNIERTIDGSDSILTKWAKEEAKKNPKLLVIKG